MLEQNPDDQMAWYIYLASMALSPIYYYQVQNIAINKTLGQISVSDASSIGITEEGLALVNFGVSKIVPNMCWPVVVWSGLAYASPWFWSNFMGFWGTWSIVGVYFLNYVGVFWFDLLFGLVLSLFTGVNPLTALFELYEVIPSMRNALIFKLVGVLVNTVIARWYY